MLAIGQKKMQLQGLIVLIINFAVIGLLPVLFFKRDGKFNLRWCLTAAPFVLSIASVVMSYLGYLPLLVKVQSWMAALAVAGSTASIALIAFTLGTHRIPIALWHQENDAPQHIVTWGAYSRIRHPFYASFLVAFVSACLFSPQVLTLLCLVYGAVVLNLTAAREEKRLLHSEFGSEYGNYIKRTGRFLPPLGT